MKISVLLISALFSLKLFAEPQCLSPNYKAVDLRSEMGPIRNQGGIGWCYGFTAADLMTHYLYKKGVLSSVNEETMVSALSVGAAYNKSYYTGYSPEKEILKRKYDREVESNKKANEGKSLLSLLNPFANESTEKKPTRTAPPPATPANRPGVSSPPAPKKIFKEGDLISWSNANFQRQYANDYLLPTEARKTIYDLYRKTGNFLLAREMYFNSLRNLNSKELGKLGASTMAESGHIYTAFESAKNDFCFEKEVRSGDVGPEHFDLKNKLDSIYDMAKTNEAVHCDALLSVQRVFPTLKLKEISDILRHEEKARVYETLVNNSCHHKLPPNSSGPKIEGWMLPNNYLNGVQGATDAQFEMLKRLENVLDKGTPVGINYTVDFLTKENAGRENRHASTIVGKRINSQTCKEEYILRNSFGTGCAMYKKPNSQYINCIAQANKETSDVKKNRMKSKCDRENVPTFLNPKVSCEEKSGYLFIEKNEMAKYIQGISFVNEQK